MALRRAAEQGDPVAQRMIDFERETVENLQFQQIPEAEREDVRKFYGQYRDRFADPQAAMYALRGVKAEFDQRNAKPPEKATAVPPQAKPRVATAARDAGPVAGKNDKMAFSEYLRAINKGGPEAQKLMADKDAGLKELDYSK